MRLAEVKKMGAGKTVLVNMGYKFNGSRYYARLRRTEVVPSAAGDMELCVVEPFEIAEDRCGFAAYCLGHNMLIEPKQILRMI